MRLAARLLLLVALLLPFRGAMALASGWCHAPEAGGADTMVALHQEHGHARHDRAVGHGDSHEHGHAAVLPDTDGHAPLGGNDPTASCTFSSAVCAAPPLPSGSVQVCALLPISAERFPALAPPRSSAAFGALERPPRIA